AIPAIAFFITIAVSLGKGGDKEEKASAPPTMAVAVAQNTPAASPVAAVAPTATSVPGSPTPSANNRANCAQIAGTDYRSDAARDFSVANCKGPQALAAANTTPSTSTGSTAAATPRPTTAPSTGGSTTTTGGGGNTAIAGAQAGVESPTGQRLVIPKAGINA